MRLGRSVASSVRAHLPDPRVAQMVDHFTQYVGSAPDRSPAVLCGIAHMQTAEGIWYPRGGTRAVPEALAALAQELGVEVRLGATVRRILHRRRGAVTGVELDRRRARSRSAPWFPIATPSRTHRELLPGEPAARRFEKRRRYEPACSGVVLYLGLRRRYAQLEHHNFVFSRDPHEEFAAIYRRGEPAADPTCYVCAPAPDRSQRRPARRRSALRARPHALPAPASRLARDVPGLPPHHPAKAARDRRACTIWRRTSSPRARSRRRTSTSATTC